MKNENDRTSAQGQPKRDQNDRQSPNKQGGDKSDKSPNRDQSNQNR